MPVELKKGTPLYHKKKFVDRYVILQNEKDTHRQLLASHLDSPKRRRYIRKRRFVNAGKSFWYAVSWVFHLILPSFLVSEPSLWDNLKRIWREPMFRPLRLAVAMWAVFSLSVVSLTVVTFRHYSEPSEAATNSWPFTTLANYTLSDSAKVTVADGVAKLLGLDFTDDDNASTGFAGATFSGNTTWDGTYYKMDDTSASALAFPDNKATDGWFDMTSNTLLWHFEETAANQATGGADAEDSSGDGRHGTDGNSPVYGVNGKFANAFNLDSYSAEYMKADLDATSIEDFSISFWMKPNSDGGSDTLRTLFSWNSDGSTSDSSPFMLFQRNEVSGGGRMYIDGNYYLNFSGKLTPDNWHHVVITQYRDESNDYIYELYINNESIGTHNAGTSLSLHSSAEDLVLGTGYNGSDSSVIDEFAVFFDRRLTTSEVNTIYSVQSATTFRYASFYDSRIMDAGTSTSWTGLSWVPRGPYGKSFPGSGLTETGYNQDNFAMTSNVAVHPLGSFTTSGGISTSTDISGNGIDFRCDSSGSRCPTVSDDSFFDASLLFDSSDDYLEAASTTPFDLAGGEDVSISMWFKADDVSHTNQRTLFASRHTSSWGTADRPGLLLIMCPTGVNCGSGTTEGALYFGAQDNGSGASSYANIRTTAGYNDNEWHHLVVRWDRDSGAIAKIAIDGSDVSAPIVNGDFSTLEGDVITPSAQSVSSVIGARNTSGSTIDREFDGYIDEFAYFNRYLSDDEVLDLYKRGIQRIKYQVRTCDDSVCSGEIFVGPSNSSLLYFDESNSGVNGDTPATTTLALTSNRYFQYRAFFETNTTTYNPQLSSVVVTANAKYPADNPTVIMNSGQSFLNLSGFTETLGGNNACTDIRYQFGLNNTSTFYYYDVSTSTWVASDGTYDQANTSTVVNAHISSFPTDVGTGTLYPTVFLGSNGEHQCEVDEIALTYTGPTVQFTNTTSSVSEAGSTHNLEVQLSATWGSDITVQYAATDVSANGSGTDYTLATGTSTIAAGNTTTSISITIVNDDIDESDETFDVILSNPSSQGSLGSTVTSTVTITDNDTAGVTNSVASVNVTEGGATGSYTMVLTSEPTADVNVTPVDSNSEVTFSPSKLTFSDSNWDTPQTMTVTAQNDSSAEGAHSTTITHTATSGDSNYSGISVDDVTANITDNDTAGVSLVEGDGVAVSETGPTADLHVVLLTTQPESNVTITLSTSTNNITLSQSLLTFTAANWFFPQLVTTTAIDDSIDNTTNTTFTTAISYSASSADGNYNGIAISDTTVTVTDNDSAGITQSATTASLVEGGSGTYTIVLDTEPTQDVDITLTPSADITLNTSTIEFTSATYSTAQTITITATDDDTYEESIADASVTHSVSSSDTIYNTQTLTDITVSLTDNDVAPSDGGGGRGQSAQPPSLPSGSNILSEEQQTIDDATQEREERNNPQEQVSLDEGESQEFSDEASGGSSHTLRLDEANDERARGLLQSEPVTFDLEKHETQPYDLNGDGVPDIMLTYEGLSEASGEPSFIIEYLTNEAELQSAISIEAGSYETADPIVSLRLNRGENEEITQIAISNTRDFSEVNFVPYTDTVDTWELPPCNGTKFVFVRFRTARGATADAFDTIRLTNQRCEQETLETTPPPEGFICPLELYKPYKSPDETAVYYVTMDAFHPNPRVCTKRPFRNPSSYFSYFDSWEHITVVSSTLLDGIPDDSLEFMPWGPLYTLRGGSLVKSVTTPRVYYILNATKYWVTNASVFSSLNFMFEWVEDVSDTLLNAYIPGQPLTDTTKRLRGMPVMYENNPTIYILDTNPADPTSFILRPVESEDVFDQLAYRIDRVIVLPPGELYPIGRPY